MASVRSQSGLISNFHTLLHHFELGMSSCCRFPAKISTQSCKGMMIACLAASSADLNSSTLLYLHVLGS